MVLPIVRFPLGSVVPFVYDPSPGISLKNKPSVHVGSIQNISHGVVGFRSSIHFSWIDSGLMNVCVSFPFKFARLSELTCLDCLFVGASLALRIGFLIWIDYLSMRAMQAICCAVISLWYNGIASFAVIAICTLDDLFTGLCFLQSVVILWYCLLFVRVF